MFRTIGKEILIWFESFLSVLPGSIGNRTRSYWFKFRFKTRSQVFIEPGCEFTAPNSIFFKKDGIIIGKNCFFTALACSIKIIALLAFNRQISILNTDKITFN